MRHRLTLGPVLALVTLLAGCGWHVGRENLAVAGSDAALEPRIRTAGQMSPPTYLLTLDIPRQAYLTTVQVFTGVQAIVITPKPDTTTMSTAISAGTHRLLLAPPIGIVSRPNPPRRYFTGRDGQWSADDGRPVHPYLLAITTERPVVLGDVQAALDTMDLRGPEYEALARVARTVGAASGKHWSSAAEHMVLLANP
jgi:hypothetical protein